MRKIIILVIAFTLIFPVLAHAGQTGPLWAVWTHSEKPEHCALKTVFWMALITAGVVYVANKALKDQPNAMRRAQSAKHAWEITSWAEQSRRGEQYAGTGIRIAW